MYAVARLFGVIGLLISVAAYSASGALVGQVSGGSQSLQAGVSNIMAFNAVSYDDLGFFNFSHPTRLTIPAGVQRAKFTFSTEISFSTQADAISMTVLKNGGYGSGVPGMAIQTFIQNLQNTNPQAVGTTAWIPVQPGDYFEFSISCGVGGKHTSDYTWFSVETE